jgi:hypothetical protein
MNKLNKIDMITINNSNLMVKYFEKAHKVTLKNIVFDKNLKNTS